MQAAQEQGIRISVDVNVRFHFGDAAPVPAVQPAPTPPVPLRPATPAEKTPQEMLERLQRNGGNRENQQLVWDALTGMGLHPRLTEPRTGTRTGRPQPWVCWSEQPGGPTICEVNSKSMWFTRAVDILKVHELPGSIISTTTKPGPVRFRIDRAEWAAQAINAVKACLTQ